MNLSDITFTYHLRAFDVTYQGGGLHVSTPADLPPEVEWVVAMRASGLMAFLEWEATVDKLMHQSWNRIEARWASFWRDPHPDCSQHEEDIRDAYHSRDRERLESALKAEEQWLLDWHKTHIEVGSPAIARRIVQEFSKGA